ncbi:MAG: LytR C-terminal domain-containing protein [Patescibacteria group bacterium]
MKSHAASATSTSIKTFVIYTVVVIFVLTLALGIKAFAVFQQNKFDGQEQFTLGIIEGRYVKQIVTFSPADELITVLPIEKKETKESFKAYSIKPDAWITLSGSSIPKDIGQVLTGSLWDMRHTKTELTIFDIGRLWLITKRVPEGNKIALSLTADMSEVEREKLIKKALTDTTIIKEQVTIQIINASGIPGLGGKIESVLENIGGNVVSVTTGHALREHSNIKYYGEDTYTLERLQQLLGFPMAPLQQETIAQIVITLGKDAKKTELF